MIIQCKSCERKFIVPDNAISEKGRLVQCSSCGNKWTQFPVSTKPQTKSKTVKSSVKDTKQSLSSKKIRKTTKRKIGPSIYSKEYLEKKHGIKIGAVKPEKIVKKSSNKNSVSALGFYSYLFIFIILITGFLGMLNLTQEIIIYNFPFLELYIGYIFENLNYLKLIFQQLI